MALAVDSEMASNVGFGVGSNPATPQTFSFTNTAGTVLYLIVGRGTQTAGFAAPTATYNSVSMTQVADLTIDATKAHLTILRLLSPATGANTVSIAFTSGSFNSELWAGAISFTGNDMTTPEAQTGTNSGSGTAPTITLSGVASGNISIAGAGCGAAISAQAQTLTYAINVDTHTGLGNGRASRSASSGSVTHSFTSGSDIWATAAVEVATAGGGGPVPHTVVVDSAVDRACSW